MTVITAMDLTDSERTQIAEILHRRANEIAGCKSEFQDKFPGSVELALDREIKRLRRLEEKIAVTMPVEDVE